MATGTWTVGSNSTRYTISGTGTFYRDAPFTVTQPGEYIITSMSVIGFASRNNVVYVSCELYAAGNLVAKATEALLTTSRQTFTFTNPTNVASGSWIASLSTATNMTFRIIFRNTGSSPETCYYYGWSDANNVPHPYAEINWSTPGSGVKVLSGSTWTKRPVKVWNGSSWVRRPVKVWNGSSWVTR